MSVLDSPELREAMREHREDQGLTQTGIARRLREANVKGASQTVLSQIEKGHKAFTSVPVPVRLRILQEYGFTTEEIIELNKRHDLELEYVLPGAKQPTSDQDLVRVRVTGRMGREFALVPRRTLGPRSADKVTLFDAPDAVLVDARVGRALRAGAELLLDTSAAPRAGMIVVYSLARGGWAAFIERGDDRPVPAESLHGNAAAVLKPEDLGTLVGVVFHAQLPADGLLGLIGS